MKTFLARQPLFDQKTDVVGYELLFRSSKENRAEIVDGYEATLKVIKDLLINFGIHSIAGGKRVFINFNEALILAQTPDLFKPESLVIEMLEDTVGTEGVLETLRAYKEKGYLIALDDFEYDDSKHELIELADIIKVDFMLTPMEELEALVNILKPYNKILLAEKVETSEEYEYAKTLGFSIFQGYFFQRPVVLESSETQTIPSVYIELMRELDQEEVDINNLSSVITKDTGLTFSFLKLVNSVAFNSNCRIESIETAIVRLGVKESSKLIFYNFLKSISKDDTPTELLRISLKRGKMAEQLSEAFGLRGRRSELFILGMFSLINIIMRKDMNTILQELPLNEDVIAALLGQKNELSDVLDVIVYHERQQYEAVSRVLNKTAVTDDAFTKFYLEATVWSEQICQ